jgi:hypothetical protein
MRFLALSLALVLVGCGDEKLKTTDPVGWSIGPQISGKNYSRGIDLESGAIWAVTVEPGDELDGVTIDRGPIAGRFEVAYTVTGEGLQATEGGEARLTLYFQREGDWWKGDAEGQFNRWYSLEHFPLTPGEHRVSVELVPDKWGSVMGVPGADAPTRFESARSVGGRMGLGFGNPAGRMHGVTATAPVRFELVEFAVGEPQS